MPQTAKPYPSSTDEQSSRPLLDLIAFELGTATNLDLLVAPLMEEVARRVGASVAILHLIDRGRRELFAHVDHLPGVSEIRAPIGQGIAGSVAAKSAPLASHRVPDGNQYARPGKQGWMAVPIMARDAYGAQQSVVAVLEASTSEGGAPFHDSDLALLDTLGVEVGEALAMTQLDDSAAAPSRYNMMVGQSSAMQELYAELQRASRNREPTLLVGAAGTGKSLAARAIHANSAERHQPWVHIGATSMPPSLVRHRLISETSGAAEGAAGRTLYIEHITKLSRANQERLAEALLNGDLDKTRLLATTRLDLSEEVAQGRFHPALATELRAGAINVPNLKERGADDLSRLVLFWLRECARDFDRPARGISSDALRYLRDRPWPAGLRELRQGVERAVLTSSRTVLALDDVAPEGQGRAQEQMDQTIPSGLPLADVEERYILRTLVEHHQNRTRASRALGIGRNTLVRKLRDYKK